MVLGLSDLRVGERGRVVHLNQCDKSYRRRLLAMGLSCGAEFVVMRRAPLGDPVELKVRGSLLCLRQAEAHCLMIERVSA